MNNGDRSHYQNPTTGIATTPAVISKNQSRRFMIGLLVS